MIEFDALNAWQRMSKKTDPATAALIGVSRWTFRRFKRGEQRLRTEDEIELERITGITPAQCAEFYAKVVRARAATQKKSVAEALT